MASPCALTVDVDFLGYHPEIRVMRGGLDVYENNGFGLNHANGDCFRVHIGCLNRTCGPMEMLTGLSR